MRRVLRCSGSPYQARIRIRRPNEATTPSHDEIHIGRETRSWDSRREQSSQPNHLLLRLHLAATIPSTVQGFEQTEAAPVRDLVTVLERVDALHARAWRTANQTSRRHRLPHAAQPLLARADTGSSLIIYIIATAPILALTYYCFRLAFGLFERGVKVRKEWHEGTKAKFEALKAEQEYTKLKRELEMPAIPAADELQLVVDGHDVILRVSRIPTSELDVALKKLTPQEMRSLVDHGVDMGRTVDSIAIRVRKH